VTFFRRIRQRPSTIRRESTNTTTSSVRIEESKKKSPMLFPWWCLFIAYAFSYLLIGISIVFIIARGIEFGQTTTEKWLTSMITSLFSSILLSQPIKVCLD
jgi:hypothetical protein